MPSPVIRSPSSAAAPPQVPAAGRVRASLFDADGEDREVALESVLEVQLTERQLLWVDAVGVEAAELTRLAARLRLGERLTGGLGDAPLQPQVSSDGETFRVDVRAVCEAGGRMEGRPLSAVVGRNVVLTVHAAAIPFLEDFTRQESGGGGLGQLTPLGFLAALLGWHLTSFVREVETLEQRLDDLDESVLRQPEGEPFLERLVGHRRRVSELRRLLAEHRAVYATLTRPDFRVIEDSDAAEYFDALEARFERAVAATEGLREVVLGSFDLYMTSLGQRTNDTMRVLTVATVLMGLWALVAGLFGMNFDLNFEKSGGRGFLLVVLALLGLSLAVLWVARRRRWW